MDQIHDFRAETRLVFPQKTRLPQGMARVWHGEAVAEPLN